MAQRHPHYPRNIPLSVTFEAWMLCASIAGTVLLIKTNIIADLLSRVRDFDFVASFVSGFFFSSGIVTPPAMVAIIESAKFVPMWEITVVGSIGAVCGDLLLFRFMHSRLLEYFLQMSLHPRVIRMARRVAAGPLWWLGPVLGAVVIASPLPDELGLIMMGMSTIRMVQFVPLAFVANVAGIYLTILVAQSLS